MTPEDLKLQIETTLRTTSKDFKLGEMRLQAVLFLLLVAPAGSRPQSILQIRQVHTNCNIQIHKPLSYHCLSPGSNISTSFLIRDPGDPDGRPRLTIQLRLEDTKQYRGKKDMYVKWTKFVASMPCFLFEFAGSYNAADRDARKTFLVPEIIYDPSLFLSPHVFLLAILFGIRAFNSESLNNDSHLLSTFNCHPGSNQLRLTLRDDIGEDFLFRQCVKGVLGYEMDSTRALTQSITGKMDQIHWTTTRV